MAPALPHTPVDLSIHHSCSLVSLPWYTTTVFPSAPTIASGSPATPVVIEPQSVHRPLLGSIATLRNSPPVPRATTCNDPPLVNTTDGRENVPAAPSSTMLLYR